MPRWRDIITEEACWGLRKRLVTTLAEFQHSMVYYATDQCRKRLKACINAEGGQFEHLLWHCLPDIPVATHNNRFFSVPPTDSLQSLQHLKERNKPSVRCKSFAIHKWVWWHFQVGWASGLQFVFFCDKKRKHLPTPPENVTTLTCELQNFCIWLKVCYVLSNAGGSEESQLVALKRTGCYAWQLECQASNVTASVQTDHLLR